VTNEAPRRPAARTGGHPAGPAPLESGTDARRAVEVWLRLVRDEAIHLAFTERRHRELARELGLDEAELAILDQFAARPGTRWNVENIRFRATEQVSVRLSMWMPLTVWLLTGGNQEWLKDLTFEYLTHHRWADLGPYALTECERFAGFVRQRVVLRRTFDPRLEPILAFEVAVVQSLKRTRDVPRDAWPVTPWSGSDDELRSLRPRPGPVTRIVELPLDLTPWLDTPDPTGIALREERTIYLIYVPSLERPHKVQILAEGARLVFGRCSGGDTIAEIAAAFEAEYGLEPAAVQSLIRRWLETGALCA